MITRKSTLRLLPATKGRPDNKQMVDTREFSDRLAHALRMNGLDNASFAKLLGENGQQNIRAWKDRGRIGGRSYRKVSDLLPLTNMDWLQYGEGSPERVSSAAEPSHNRDFRQDRSVRPIPEMLSSAYQYALIGLGLYAEGGDLDLTFVPDAVFLCDVYALIANGSGALPGGEESPELQAIVEKYAGRKRGKQSDGNREDSERHGAGRQ